MEACISVVHVSVGHHIAQRISYVDFAEEPGNLYDMLLQELIQRGHVLLFPKENIVGQILGNLRNRQEALLEDHVTLRPLEIDRFRGDNSRSHEATSRRSAT